MRLVTRLAMAVLVLPLALLAQEAFNALNHPVFPAPNTTATGSSLGTISGAQANRPRSIQLGARVVF